MSANRQQRRRAARRQQQRRAGQPSDLVRRIADAYRCPDCNADTELVHDAPGVHRLKVMHDDTCPTYAAMTKGGQQ